MGYLCGVVIPILKKIVPCQKWWLFLIFEFFAKLAKHMQARIWKPVRDRAFNKMFNPRSRMI